MFVHIAFANILSSLMISIISCMTWSEMIPLHFQHHLGFFAASDESTYCIDRVYVHVLFTEIPKNCILYSVSRNRAICSLYLTFVLSKWLINVKLRVKSKYHVIVISHQFTQNKRQIQQTNGTLPVYRL